MALQSFEYLVLDIGGVLLSCSSMGGIVLPSCTIKTILDSPV